MKLLELTNEFSLGNGRSRVISDLASVLNQFFDVEIWYSYYVRKPPEANVKLVRMSQAEMLRRLIKIREPTILHTHFGKVF